VADWTLLVKDSKGQLLLKATGKGVPPADYLWDAKDMNGVQVNPGTYNAVIQVKDIAGRQSTTDFVYFKAVAPLSLENVQWALASDAVFPSAQAELRPACQIYLTNMTANLRKYFTNFDVEVQGHTDNNPCRLGPHCKFKNNWVLSEARAQAVKNLLVKLGLRPEDVVTHGYADTVPVADNRTVEGKTKNRRIEIKIKSYKKATAVRVTNAAIFLMIDGQPEFALQLFKDVIEHDPDKVEPYRYLVNCYQTMGKAAEAQKANAIAAQFGGAMPQPFAPLRQLTTAPMGVPTEPASVVLSVVPTMTPIAIATVESTPKPSLVPTVVPISVPTSAPIHAKATPVPTPPVQATATPTGVPNFIGRAWNFIKN
jgi:outer membrane protein OmpA-like peptidoglycan-associated protein